MNKLILHGFVGLHSHVYSPDSGQDVSPEYIPKAHAITTIHSTNSDDDKPLSVSNLK